MWQKIKETHLKGEKQERETERKEPRRLGGGSRREAPFNVLFGNYLRVVLYAEVIATAVIIIDAPARRSKTRKKLAEFKWLV